MIDKVCSFQFLNFDLKLSCLINLKDNFDYSFYFLVVISLWIQKHEILENIKVFSERKKIDGFAQNSKSGIEQV